MGYVPLTATKALLGDYCHEIDWEAFVSNIALWDVFFKNSEFQAGELLRDIEVLETHTPRDLAFFVNAHAIGSTQKMSSRISHHWLGEYRKWVQSKCS